MEAEAPQHSQQKTQEDGMQNEHSPNRNQIAAWCQRLLLMAAIVPFGSASAVCEDGCPELPPWCQDGVPDDCLIPDLVFEIKPYSEDHCLRLDDNGVIPVLIFGDTYLHADDIDTATLSLNGLDVRVRGGKGPLCSIHDANQDGYPNLFCQFEDDPTQWVAGNALAELTGERTDGAQFSGSQYICVQ
jgi:hypothetical protein